eukprot:jgi/Tetstr1/421964/TSEL_012863.t1
MSYETLKHLRHLARAGDWFVSMDLADGYYALGIREEDRDFFTVNYRGELWRLAGRGPKREQKASRSKNTNLPSQEDMIMSG